MKYKRIFSIFSLIVSFSFINTAAYAIEKGSIPLFPFNSWSKLVTERKNQGLDPTPELLGYVPITDSLGNAYKEPYYSDTIPLRLVCKTRSGCENFRVFANENMVAFEYPNNFTEYFGFTTDDGTPFAGFESALIVPSQFIYDTSRTESFYFPINKAHNNYGSYLFYYPEQSGFRYDGKQTYTQNNDRNNIPYTTNFSYGSTIAYVFVKIKALEERKFVYGANYVEKGKPIRDEKFLISPANVITKLYLERGYVWQFIDSYEQYPSTSATQKLSIITGTTEENSIKNGFEAGLKVALNVVVPIGTSLGNVGSVEFSAKTKNDWGTSDQQNINLIKSIQWKCPLEYSEATADKTLLCGLYRLNLTSSMVVPGLQQSLDKFNNLPNMSVKLEIGSPDLNKTTDDEPKVQFKTLTPVSKQEGQEISGAGAKWSSYHISVPAVILNH